MNSSPDRLHPLEGYFLLFERALRLPHDPAVERKLRAVNPIYRYRSDYNRQGPLPIAEILADEVRTEGLVTRFNRDFADPRVILFSPVQRGVLFDFFGIVDGMPRTARVIAGERDIETAEAANHVQSGINKVIGYLRTFAGIPRPTHVETISARLRVKLLE